MDLKNQKKKNFNANSNFCDENFNANLPISVITINFMPIIEIFKFFFNLTGITMKIMSVKQIY